MLTIQKKQAKYFAFRREKAPVESGLKGRKQSDKRVRSTVLIPSDRVLVRNLSPRGGPGKIRAFWEEEIHVVVSRKNPERPVYDIKPESGKGKIRTLHRNLLLPCDYLPTATPETKRVEKVKEQTPIIRTPEDSEYDSEGEEGLSLPPNEMDELVQLSLRPESANDATVDPSTNGDINQSREVHGNENDANRLNIQVEETMETPGDVEETPPQPVRPQRQRQPPLRFGYNAPTGEFPFIWQDPNAGLVQIRDPWFGPPWIGPIQLPIIPVPWMSRIQNPMFHAQVMNPMISPPPFGYYPTY